MHSTSIPKSVTSPDLGKILPTALCYTFEFRRCGEATKWLEEKGLDIENKKELDCDFKTTFIDTDPLPSPGQLHVHGYPQVY